MKLICGMLLILLVAPVEAQNAGLAGPVLGYVLESGAVRPILGIPGASIMGDAEPLGFNVRLGQVAPRGDYLLAVAAEGDVRVVPLGSIPLHGRPIPGAAYFPDRLVLSPTGSAALLVYSSVAWAQVVTGLPGAPVVAGRNLDGLPEIPGALAISDDGGAIIAAAAGSVFSIARDSSVRSFPAAGPAVQAAFAAGTHDAVVAGPGGAGLISDITARPVFRVLASIDGLQAPVGLVATTGHAYLAGPNVVASVDLATGATVTTPCNCTISGLTPLAGAAVFRLTEPSGGPLWLIDASGPQARVLFVPPAAEVNLQ